MKLRILLASVALVFAVCSTAAADSVYRYKDENGVTHYTSKKPTPDAKPAKLPPINRGEVKLTKRKLISCSSHGGIDCTAGPDRDGSVICRDGFAEASPRYRFSCNSPKLEITDVSDPNPEGGFSVFVRNKKSIEAKHPALFFKPNIGQETKLNGPAKIEPFGMAEFTFAPHDEAQKLGATQKINIAQLNLTCANCP